MGLFDFFRRKKQNNSIPASLQEAITILFPNGNDDRLRQLKELGEYFDSRYELDYINENLIFILSGYLITGNLITKEKAVARVLSRVGNKMTSTDVEYLHDYALKNHPKLSMLKIVEFVSDALGEGGCETDIIPGGYGKYGYSPTNPIPTKGVLGIYDYLSRLYDVNQHCVDYIRVGTVVNEISTHPIDEFQISSAKGVDTLYFSAYQSRTSRLSPCGYTLLDECRQVLPTANCDDSSVKKAYHIKPSSIPKLLGLSSFACLSSNELIGKTPLLVEAETYNKKAIILANQEKVEDALDALDKAISLQSLNAVNNKFTILITADRYHEGYKYLESIVDTPNMTVRSLCNLAILYYRADFYTEYKVNKDVAKAYTLLLKAANLPSDEREVGRENTIIKVAELISQLEQEGEYL